MAELKQVKVDNWGIFFLQRLKHFFNRTDYCDLTLQFQDNAQLKVHRLVLNACTEYFELLERTCEMYEDCLVMPDDLQADVVVPIVNFMYTGQLEFRMDLLERLYQTSLVMNMPVLTKLLDAHRNKQVRDSTSLNYSTYTNPKRYAKSYETPKHYSMPSSSNATSSKRSYSKAFNNDSRNKYKSSLSQSEFGIIEPIPHSVIEYHTPAPKKQITSEPRPTRYELPEELETDNLFDNSFTNISYTSKPLMVHPETTKRYPPKRTGIFEDPSTSKRFIHGRGTMDIVECKKMSVSDQMFEDDPSENMCGDQDIFPQPIKDEPRDSSQLFDQMLDGGPKVTIETKDNKQSNNLDHAKIISEVLKKYPHLVKSNKNIKLKILNTPTKKKAKPAIATEEEKEVNKQKALATTSDYAYESKVLDSKEAAKLIALGADNTAGPWICLICGAPGKAIHFRSYYKFRRHLVDVHNEKPILNMCEYCGHKSVKRNYLLHHLYTKHGVDPPAHYRFPKCSVCNYVAVTEGLLLKHKCTHPEKRSFRCNVCASTFPSSNQLLVHIQRTGHKYSADRQTNLQCIYCFKTFLRESNLYAHLRSSHKESARSDGIIDLSDDEKSEPIKENKIVPKTPTKQEIKTYEVPVSFENDYEFEGDVQYQIHQQPDGNIQVVSKKPRVLLPTVKHKILNSGLNTSPNKIVQKSQLIKRSPGKHNDFVQNPHHTINNPTEEVVVIDNNEYIVKDNRLIPKIEKSMGHEDYSMPNIIHTEMEESVDNIITTSSEEYTNVPTTPSGQHKMIVNKPSGVNQPIQIVVSNEEEYKALMASNHSIIFEDTDVNKTLTVLTAPNENNTTIDLDHTQSNDMMILPDNYPLNVSDSVTGNNSNIVVVYSHPVDDQNKEYQLITSDNLEAQFVTSTAILTQNYETVTTSAPIMNAHVLETSVEDSWSNAIPQNIASNRDLQVPIGINQDIVTPIENQKASIANLEEVQLPPIHSESVDEHHANGELNTQTLNVNCLTESNNVIDAQPDVINPTETQSELVETVSTLPPSNMDVDCINSNEVIKDNPDQPIEDLDKSDKMVSQDNTETEDISVTKEESTSKKQALDDTEFVQNVNSQDSCESETIENIAKAIQSSESGNSPVEADIQESTVNESTENTEVSSTKAKEQIQNLTSEWSDDELETLSQEHTSQQDSNGKQVRESEEMDTGSQSDIEESVENIQQEMEKQISKPERVLTNTQSVESSEINVTENINVSSKELVQEEPEKASAILSESNKKPDKISSLLNDWEDNESQEGETEIETPNEVENTENPELIKEDDLEPNPDSMENEEEADSKIQTQNAKPDAKTGENIQSLVSDWVEDDEDEAAPGLSKLD